MNFIGRVARLTLAAALVTGLGTTTSHAAMIDNRSAQTPDNQSANPSAQTDNQSANPSAQTPDNASADNSSASANGPSAVVEGQVAAASESGALVLRTDDGMIGLQVSPADIQGVSIGETVRVPIFGNTSE